MIQGVGVRDLSWGLGRCSGRIWNIVGGSGRNDFSVRIARMNVVGGGAGFCGFVTGNGNEYKFTGSKFALNKVGTSATSA